MRKKKSYCYQSITTTNIKNHEHKGNQTYRKYYIILVCITPCYHLRVCVFLRVCVCVCEIKRTFFSFHSFGSHHHSLFNTPSHFECTKNIQIIHEGLFFSFFGKQVDIHGCLQLSFEEEGNLSISLKLIYFCEKTKI